MITRWDDICCLCLTIIASSSHHTTPNLFNKCLPNPKSAVPATAAPSPCPYRSPPFPLPPSSVTVSTAAPHAVLCMLPHFPFLLHATIDGKNYIRFSVNLRIMENDDAVEKGQTKTYADKGTSGKDVTRHFCGDCGSYVAFSDSDGAFLPCLYLSTNGCKQSPVFSILEVDPGAAYVKGGLFRKMGVDLPSPGVQIWHKNHERWERELVDGVQMKETQ
jgi:hypothetical protein